MEYKCKVCIKDYSSYQSLWIHNKKYHKYNVNHNVNIVNHNVIICKFCKKKFSARQSRWRHEKICKVNETTIIKQESIITNNINNTQNITNIIKFGSTENIRL